MIADRLDIQSVYIFMYEYEICTCSMVIMGNFAGFLTLLCMKQRRLCKLTLLCIQSELFVLFKLGKKLDACQSKHG